MPHTDSTSRALLNAASSGGELDSLYRTHRDGIRRYVARTFGTGPPDPEDVVQAAFEKFAGLEDRAAVENPRAFLLASARNYVLDQRRRLKVRADHRDAEQYLDENSDDLNAERVLSAKQRWTVVEEAIRGMDTRRQEILIMNRIHGLSCAEISRRRNCSPTLVKMLLAQALMLCERALREAEPE